MQKKNKMKIECKVVSTTTVKTVRYIEHPCGVVAYEPEITEDGGEPVIQVAKYALMKDVKEKTIQGFWLACKDRRWVYLTDAMLSRYLEPQKSDTDFFYKYWSAYAREQSPMEQIKKEGFNKSQLYSLESNLVYRMGEEYPINRPFHLEAEIDDQDFDLGKALKILKAHPWVSNPKIVQHPWYENSDRRALDFVVFFPQSDFEDLTSRWKCRRNFSDQTKLTGYFVKTSFRDYDPLGLKPAWKGSRYAGE